MSELDVLARRHAAVTREVYDGAQPPPLASGQSRSPSPPRERRHTLAAGLALAVAAAVVAAIVVASIRDPGALAPAGEDDPVPSVTDSEVVATPPVDPAPVDPVPVEPTPPVLPDQPVALPQGWEHIGDLPFPTGRTTLAAPLGDGLVLVGPGGTWRVHAEGSWAQGEPSPSGISSQCCSGHRLASTPAGVVLLAGRGTWLLDGATLTWREVADRPFGGEILGTALVDGRLVVVEAASRSRSSLTSSSVAVLDLESLTWTELDPVPGPVSVGGVTSDGERLFVAGTRQGRNNNIIGDHTAYRHVAGAGWDKLPDVPISGQASTLQWLEGAGLLAWNYGMESALFEEDGQWRSLGQVPMDSGECYPLTEAEAAVGLAVAEFCGQLALLDVAEQRWWPVQTGVLPRVADYLLTGGAIVGHYPVEPESTRLVRYPLSGPVSEVTAEDYGVALAFQEFATSPDEIMLEITGLPLADRIQLGLGDRLLTEITPAEAADARAWEIDVDNFRGATGPFSALEPLAVPGAVDVHVDETPRCAGPPGAPPPGTEGMRRVAIQPAAGSLDSCLGWFSVDLFLDQGQVAAVTLDLWEP